jgi:thiol-disulfide isomerase/thioredoxin
MKIQNLIIFIMLFTAIISGCSDAQKNSVSSIHFSIAGLDMDTIRLYRIEPLTLSETNYQELILDETGKGTLEIHYPDKSFAYLKIGDNQFSIILVDGSDLRIRGNGSDIPNTIEISGKGSLANNYLQEKAAIIRKYNNLDGRFFIELDSAAFWDRMHDYNREIDTLNAWLATQKMDRELESLLRLESQQTANIYILNYALVKGHKGPEYSGIVPYDRNLFLSHSSAYSAVLVLNYSFDIVGPIWRNSGASNSDSIAYIFPQVFESALDTLGIPDYAKDYYMAEFLTSYFELNRSNPVLEGVYASWRNDFPDSPFSQKVAEIYKGISNLAPGHRAPTITGIDQSGNEFSLEQFKGHYIYVDVWATWCSPCREKIPAMYALMEEFRENSQIEFMFVSVDEDLEKWKDYISRLPSGILHINAGGTSIRKDYMIPGVPHYILVDPSGKIYDSNAPDPDTEEIKSLLTNLTKSDS